jgi:hypothetical protein
MTIQSAQPFGRRGRVPAPAPSHSVAQTVPARSRLGQKNLSVSPDVVAAILNPNGDPDARMAAHGAERVPRSFRAAILAGLIVAIVSAATNATFAAVANQDLGVLSAFGANNAPIVVALLLGALWSGGRTSAMCLLVTHRMLSAMQRTSHISYGIGGGIVALALAFLMQALGHAPGPGGLGMETLMGVGAGMFYRLFAGAQRAD